MWVVLHFTGLPLTAVAFFALGVHIAGTFF